MIAWFTRNHVAANLLMATIIFLGIFSLKTQIPLEVFPTFQLEVVSVEVSLRGSTPEDVEESVSIRIEEAVQDLEGIKKISSRSTESTALVNIEIDSGYDSRDLLNDIKTRVDAINTFPAEAEKPVISLGVRKRDVISVAIAGNFSEAEIRQQAERVRDDLLRIPGITQLKLSGVRDYEIGIEVSSDKLRQYQLQLADVANAVKNSSLDLSAGNVKTRGGDILLRLKGQAYNRTQYENIVVASTTDGSLVRLKDIAEVKDGFVEDAIHSRFNGKPAALIDVYRVGDQSAIDVADKVKDYIAKQQPQLPEGFEISYWSDRSKIVKARLATLTNNAIQGGILVLALLTMFLRPSVALWVFVGVPVSFMGAFIFMPYMGVTMNVVSLFGFILVLGIVVDDAIVTGENIYRHIERDGSGEQSVIRGTEEVAIPVTFGILTTVAAFIPMTLIEGVRGEIFRQIALVIIPILLFSLIESKFVLPSHLKHIKAKQAGKEGRFSQFQRNFAKGFERAILRYYQPALSWCISHRYAVLASFIGLFIVIATMISSGWMRFVFFPKVESETSRVTLTMPSGTPFEVTDRHVQFITEQAFKLKEKYRDPDTGESVILNIYSSSGNGGTHKGRVRFQISSPEDREIKITNTQLTNEWRKMIGSIPGVEQLAFRSEIVHANDPIDVELSGSNYRDLEAVAEQIKDYLDLIPGVFDITDSMSDGKEEVRLVLKPEAYALGLTDSMIITQVREAFYGYEAQRIQRGRDDVRVMVRYPKDERRSLTNLKDLRVTTSDGRKIPIAQVVELIPGKSPTAIYRNNLARTLNVTADIDKDAVNMTVVSQELRDFIEAQLQHYPGISYALEGEQQEQSESMGSIVYGLIFVFFAIYVLLAIPFKSYALPLIVMSIIPFGTIGAILGHWLMGKPLTFFSVLGILALIGVVVNDSLVLVEFINQQRKKASASVMEAIKTAGAARFRPVLLTSLTTFFGLLPLLFEQSTQAQFLIPMAISLAFGIIFATLITLLLVPVNYAIAYELKQKIMGKGRR
jgi:multidrug efflux pump subunit AcrB